MWEKLAINGGKPVRERAFSQWPIYGGDELKLVREVLDSRHWGGWWPREKCEEFQEKFAKHQGAAYGIICGNGSVAIETALRALGIKAGDEVIVTPVTWIATATSVLMVNAVPIFVDVDPQSYCLDPEKIGAVVTKKTKAIVLVHFGGIVADMDSIMEVADKYRLAVVEDAAHAHGAKWGERGAGSIGHIGTFSFQDLKLMTAGEGGIILTNDERLNEKCRSLVNCGRLSENDSFGQQVLGSNFRTTNFQAAILLAQLGRLNGQNEKRRENVNYLQKELEKVEGVYPIKGYEKATNVYYTVGFRYDPGKFGGVSGQKFVGALHAELLSEDRNSPAGKIPLIQLQNQPVYKHELFVTSTEAFPQACSEVRSKLDYSKIKCPIAENLNIVRLGHRMFLGTKEDMNDVVGAIVKIQKHSSEL